MSVDEIIKLILKLKREQDDIIDKLNDQEWGTIEEINRIDEIDRELKEVNKMENNPFRQKYLD